MTYADRLKVTSSSTSAASIAMGAAVPGCRALAQAITEDAGKVNAIKVGDQNVSFVVTDSAGNWEAGYYTITSATQIDQTQRHSSSNGGLAVTFNGQGLTVSNDVLAEDLVLMAQDTPNVAFTQSIPLAKRGIAWMVQQTVAAKYTFTPAAGAVQGAVATGRLVADGVSANAPDTSAFKTIGGTAAYNNVAGSVNLWEASYDGYNYWWAWAQEGSTASSGSGADTTAPVMAGSLASSNITSGGFTLTWSAASDNVGVTSYEVSTNGGSSYTNVGNVLTWAATGMAANTAYSCMVRADDAAGNKSTPLSLTVTTSASSDTTAPTMTGTITASAITQTSYTLAWSAGSDNVGVTGYEYSVDGGTSWNNAGNVLTVNITGRTAGATDQVRVRDYDAAGNRGTALSASVTLQAATAPGAPTIGTATGGDTTATVTWTAPASNGGSSITGYTVTSTPGSFTATAAAGATSATVTGLTDGTAYTFTVHATNAVGNSAESAASNSVTPAAVVWPQLGTLTHVTQSGTGPYDYTGDGMALSTSTNGGLLTKSLAAGVDGYIEAKVITAGDIIFGFRLINSVAGYSGLKDGIYVNTTTYRSMKDGVNSTLSGFAVQAGDIMRVTRVGTLHKLQLARAATPTSFTDMDSYDYGSSPIMYMQACVFGSSVLRLTGMGGFA